MFAASVRAIVAEVEGNVIVVPSVPASVRVFDAVSVLPLATVKTADVAGAVIVNLLTLVAVAAPNDGVTRVGDVENTRLVDVVPVAPAAV